MFSERWEAGFHFGLPNRVRMRRLPQAVPSVCFGMQLGDHRMDNGLLESQVVPIDFSPSTILQQTRFRQAT